MGPRRRGNEGDGKGGLGRIVGPMEVGVEEGQVVAESVELVVGEGLGGAGG